MAGRKPKPTNLKILEGTFRKDRANPNEPKVNPSIPSPPEFLDEKAVEEWNRLAPVLFKMGLLSDIYLMTFAGYCESVSMYVDACELRNELKRRSPELRGLVDITKIGNQIQTSIAGTINSTRKAMKDFLVEFGMSPSSISKVTPQKKEEDNKDWKAN